MKTSIVLSLFGLFLYWLPARSQSDTASYDLLWEISGKDLEEPSYLFGSMHLRDKRIFNFPDSLFDIMAGVDAFANEVHLDSFMLRSLEAVDDSAYFALFDKAPRAINPVGFGGILASFLTDRDREEMPTMMDAYLMDLAKKQGKVLFGLEKLEDYFPRPGREKATSSVPFSILSLISSYQELQDLYIAGNSGEIYRYVRESIDTSRLIKRNYLMADAIERITRQYSLLSVVGAAHLAGDEGVLEILRSRGYRVRPVTASFSGILPSPAAGDQVMPWAETRVGPVRFHTPLPARAFPEYEGVPMHMAIDIGEGIAYYFFTLNGMLTSADVYFESFKEGLTRETQIEIVEEQELPTGEGYEFILTNPAEEWKYARLRVTVKGGRLIFQQVAAFIPSRLYHPGVDRFFDSVEVETMPAGDWVEVRDSLGAFTVQMPAGYEYMRQETPGPSGDDDATFELHFYLANDPASEKGYVLSFTDMPDGYVIESDSVALFSLLEYIEGTLQSVPERWDTSRFSGYPALRARFTEEGVHAETWMLLRGNRKYLLMEMGNDGADASSPFFDSFAFIPTMPVDLTEQRFLNGALQVEMPDAALATFDEDYYGEIERYDEISSNDPHTSAAFLMEVVTYRPYYEVGDIGAFYDENLEYLLGEGETILETKNIETKGAYPVRQYLTAFSNSHLLVRYQLQVQGNRLIVQYVYLAPEHRYSVGVDRFFESLRLDCPDSFDLQSPKSELILRDLLSTDSLVFEEASMALSYHTFPEAFLAPLMEAYEKEYPEDIRADLMYCILETGDDAALDFLLDRFTQTEDPELKREMLSALVSVEGRDVTGLYLELAAQMPDDPNTPFSYDLFYIFLDSLPLFMDHYETVDALAGRYWEFKDLLFDLSAEVLAEGTETQRQVILGNLDRYNRFMEEALANYEDVRNDEELPFSFYAPLDFYDEMPFDNSILKLIRKLGEKDQGYLRLRSLNYFLKHDQKIPKNWTADLLEDPMQYFSTLELFREYDRLDEIDGEFLDHQRIAEGMLIKQIGQFEQEVSLRPLEERTIDFRGEQVRIYTFRIKIPDPEKGTAYYLGMAGPFPEDKNSMEFSDELVNYTYEELTDFNYEELLEGLIRESVEFVGVRE